MTSERLLDKPPVVRYVDRELVMKVYQVVQGEYVCHCGAPATLSVTTQPDGEPGLVCSKHGLEWIDALASVFRPKR